MERNLKDHGKQPNPVDRGKNKIIVEKLENKQEEKEIFMSCLNDLSKM